MSFVAAISNPRNISAWSRACVSLAGISDQISFTVLARSLSMLAVNSSRTTYGEITFERAFFKDLAFVTDNIVDDGYTEPSQDGRRGASYAFVVSSKNLVMLLRSPESQSLNYVYLRVYCSRDTPQIRRYKLNVEILTKKLVLKKYPIAFNPVLLQHTDIPDQYASLLEDNDINKISTEISIIKQFLETTHTSTEDFKIDIKLGKITFTAYTNQVVKDRDYLKHPMLTSILMATEDLEFSALDCLDNETVILNFRLRDLRNFIALAANLRADASKLEAYGPDPHNTTFDALFQAPGDPILFQYADQNTTVSFIQMTADESGVTPAKLQAGAYLLPVPVVLKKRAVLEEEPAHKRAKPGIKTNVGKKTKPRNDIEIDTNFENANSDHDAFEAFEPSFPRITYGEAGSRPDSLLTDANIENTEGSGRGENDDTEYSSSGEESVTEFGPTQARDKPQLMFR